MTAGRGQPQSEALREGTRALVERAVETASMLLKGKAGPEKLARGGRKAQRLEVQRAGDNAD